MKKGAEARAEAETPAALPEPPPPKPAAVDPARKAAIAVMVLGDDMARDIIKLLPDDQVERLLATAETLGDVSAEEVADVMRELTEEVEREVPGVSGRQGMIREVAADALGRDALTALLGRDSGGATEKLQRAALADPPAFAQTVAREHPQVISVVLSILPPEIGGLVLKALPPHVKPDVVRRVATLRSVPAQVLSELAEIMGRELRPPDQAGPLKIDGTQVAVDLLKRVGADDETAIFDDLERRDEELAEELRNRMFVFEDVLKLHPREVQLILREVDGQQLALSLKGASPALKEFLLSNMSSRAALIVMDDLEAMGPVSRAQVEQAQKEIIAVILRLAEEEKVNLRPGDTV